jgi:acyl carrier protein
LDSLDIIRLISSIDSEFSISIEGEDILPENFTNMAQIVALVENRGGRPNE